jgi:hypothetical protein
MARTRVRGASLFPDTLDLGGNAACATSQSLCCRAAGGAPLPRPKHGIGDDKAAVVPVDSL